MKKRICAAVCAMLIVANFVYIPEANGGSDLRCDDLTGCSGRAGCGGKGRPTGCDIVCADGSEIKCPRTVE
jgi:hypothetical protein